MIAHTNDETTGTFNSSAASWYKSTEAYVTRGNLCANDFQITSDVRLKKNIEPLDKNICEKLLSPELFKEFDFIKSGDHAIGVIAQELEKIAPHLVSQDEESEEGWRHVKYSQLHTAWIYGLLNRIIALETTLENIKNLTKI